GCDDLLRRGRLLPHVHGRGHHWPKPLARKTRTPPQGVSTSNDLQNRVGSGMRPKRWRELAIETLVHLRGACGRSRQCGLLPEPAIRVTTGTTGPACPVDEPAGARATTARQ